MTYRASYRLEPDGRWLVDVPELRDCRVHARTFQEARSRIREMLRARLGGDEPIEIVDEILRLTPRATAAVAAVGDEITLVDDADVDLDAAAASRLPVLVTGSEAFAQLVASRLQEAAVDGNVPMIVVDCAATPDAVDRQIAEAFREDDPADGVGPFAPAFGGDAAMAAPVRRMVVLQRIESLPPRLQRLVGERARVPGVRIVAASTIDLHERCALGLFDERTFYRLNAIHIVE